MSVTYHWYPENTAVKEIYSRVTNIIMQGMCGVGKVALGYAKKSHLFLMLSYVWASPGAPGGGACVSCQSRLHGSSGFCAHEVLISLAFACCISQGWQVSSWAVSLMNNWTVVEQLSPKSVQFRMWPHCFLGGIKNQRPESKSSSRLRWLGSLYVDVKVCCPQEGMAPHIWSF